MGRFFGGKIGTGINASNELTSLKGVFSLFDVFYSRTRGGWFIPRIGGSDSSYVFNGYQCYVFSSVGNGVLTVSEPGNIDVFLIGGGGAGGRSYGDNDTGKGGGGAGQALWRQNFNVSAGSYPFSVGAGGVGRNTPESGNSSVGQGNHGQSTTINFPTSITARGGFGGAGSDCYGPFTATGYGCGGGGGARNGSCSPRHNGVNGGQNTYSGWTSYTNPGGGSASGNYSGGGGGGCGGAGGNYSGGSNDPNSQAGAGGVGVDMSPFFGTLVGDGGYFGGGGGGGTYCYGGPVAYRAAGGTGGGGKGNTAQETSQGGAFDNSDIDGQANTGGGGGGSSEGPNNGGSHSGYGGSGIILIRHN